MNCKYCNQSDENRLALSSKLVNGKVVHEWVCLDCLFRDMFQTVKEYGKPISDKISRRFGKREQKLHSELSRAREFFENTGRDIFRQQD